MYKKYTICLKNSYKPVSLSAILASEFYLQKCNLKAKSKAHSY